MEQNARQVKPEGGAVAHLATQHSPLDAEVMGVPMELLDVIMLMIIMCIIIIFMFINIQMIRQQSAFY